MEQLRGERDKLRSDIGEANDRANLFAQEMDEQQNRMEKCRKDQLRQLELRQVETIKNLNDQYRLDREKNTSAIKSLEELLEASQFEEKKLRTELMNVLKDLNDLERENQNLSEEIHKLEASNKHMSCQLLELAAVGEQVNFFFYLCQS